MSEECIQLLLLDKSVKLSYVLMKTGDRKKGKTTDYVARQFIGNLEN